MRKRFWIFCAMYLLILLFLSGLFLSWNSFRVLFLSAVLSAWGIAVFLQFLIHRKRPFETSEKIALVYPSIYTPSFPSAHAAISFAMAGMILFHYGALGLLFFLVAFLIAWSRVVVGVHYKSDVVAGALLGFLISILFSFL